MWFATEEDRAKALRDLPKEPAPGQNRDSWNKEMDQKTLEIMTAEIGGEPPAEAQPTALEEKPQEQKPPEPVQPPVRQSLSDEDEVVIKLKRSDLPENLQKYKDGAAIVRSFSAARAYADQAERDKIALEAERDQFRKAKEERDAQIEALRKQSEDVKAAAATVPTPERAESRTKIATLDSLIAGLQEVNDQDMVEGSQFKRVMSQIAGGFQQVISDMHGNFKKELETTKREALNEVGELKRTYSTMTEGQRKEQERREKEQKEKEAQLEIVDLQAKYKDDLGTTKPAFGQGDTVEQSVRNLTDRICRAAGVTSDSSNPWVLRYKVLAGLINGDPDVKRICDEQNIQVADVGLSDDDLSNWMLLVRAHNAKSGRVLTANGHFVDDVDSFGRPRMYPNAESAYLDIASKSGLLRAREEQRIVEAEKKGQRSFEEALSRRETKILGPTEGSPDNIGEMMTEDMANEVFGVKPGRHTVDHLQMEMELRQGLQSGWNKFTQRNKARERLGLPPEKPEKYWKRPKAVHA